jgi:hypothetical protein
MKYRSVKRIAIKRPLDPFIGVEYLRMRIPTPLSSAASTTFLVLAVSASPLIQAATIDLYHFEGNLNDSGQAGYDATVFTGNPAFTNSVPSATINGIADTASLSLASDASLVFNYAFPFDYLEDATLSFWVNPSSLNTEQDLFWTTDQGGDTNRFNMGINTAGAFYMDYRSPSGALHSVLGSAGGMVVANQWTFVEIDKTGNQYTLFINGAPAATGTDTNPDLPNGTGWTINGRQAPCCDFSGLVDEVSLSSPVPEPALAGMVGLLILGAMHLRRR